MSLAIAIFVAVLTAILDSATAQTIDELRQAVQSTTDRSAQARLYKQLGDALVEHDNLEQAAAAFSEALAVGRERFSANERLQMAIYLSWADRLQDSEDELKRLLAEDPKNVPARTHLARVLSWSGELGAAIEEADKVLRDAPDHKDALLVKADALQWQGRYIDAMPIYQAILARDNDFDARVGLSRCLLAVRNRTGALENLNALKPANARQKREFAKLTEAINQETRPTVEARYNHYHDSDHNDYDRYSFVGDFWVENQKYGLTYRHTGAGDPTRNNRVEDLLFGIYSRLSDAVGAGAGIGFTQLVDHQTSHFGAGFLRVDTRLFGGTAGANVTRELLSDTAELIENRIRMTTVGLYLSQPLTERFSVYSGYNYKNFSDGNHANDLQLTYQYAIYLSPRIVLGHRFRFLDYFTQSHSGFFDPNSYIANRAFSSFYYEHRFFYTYLEGYIGYQTFWRDAVRTKEVIHGGSGSVGVKPISNLSMELNVEGGNFAAGSASGFSYFIIGPRILFRF